MSGALVRITIGGTGPAKYDVYDANDVDNHLLALKREHEQQLAALQADAERYKMRRDLYLDERECGHGYTPPTLREHWSAEYDSNTDKMLAARASEGEPK
jgi:hypothetical protein